MDIRKTIMIKETIEADSVGEVCDPITRVVAVAVIQNPFAGRFIEDLSPLFDIGGQLGERLIGDAVKMLAGPPVSYGKAAIIGIARPDGWSGLPGAGCFRAKLRDEILNMEITSRGGTCLSCASYLWEFLGISLKLGSRNLIRGSGSDGMFIVSVTPPYRGGFRM